MKSICAISLSAMIALGSGTSTSAADLTEDQIRAIVTEVAERVAREVATEVAGVIAAQMAEEIAAEVAAEVVEEVLARKDAEGSTGQETTKLALTPEFLADPAHIAVGKEIWQGQCALCHGANSYPGKAPKLKPKRYTPDFVFDRVTNGFRKMPAWREVYTEEERMSLVAWVLSKKFSP